MDLNPLFIQSVRIAMLDLSGLPGISEDDEYLFLLLAVSHPEGLQPTDTVTISFIDLFAPDETTAPRIIACPWLTARRREDAFRLVFELGAEGLRPSFYRMEADLVRAGTSLTGGRKAQGEVYVRSRSESGAHALGSFLCGRSEHFWDDSMRCYAVAQPFPLPAMRDHDDGAASVVASKKPEEAMWPELLYGGAMGFLRAAETFRDLGDTDRQNFCERALRRMVDDMVFGRMTDDAGRIHAIGITSGARLTHGLSRQHEGLLLAWLVETVTYFSAAGGDATYARSLAERLAQQGMFQCQEPFRYGIGFDGFTAECGVYDGRILEGGCAWLRLACDTMEQKDIWPFTRGPIAFAFEASRHLLRYDGWYDDHCYGEKGCHPICGNANIVGGLLAARRLVLHLGALWPSGLPYVFCPPEDAIRQIEAGLEAAVRFVTMTQAELTGLPIRFAPGYWGVGQWHDACLELREIFYGKPLAPFVEKLLVHLEDTARRLNLTEHIHAFHRLNVLGPLMHACRKDQA